MNDLHIKWDTGHMTIHMDYFFPCSLEKFKKLLKVIEFDFQHKKELIEILKVYFQNRIVDLIELRKINGKRYFDYKQRQADTERMIESGKYPNGVQLSKDDLEQVKKDLREYKKAAKKALLDANRNLKYKERFEKYLQVI